MAETPTNVDTHKHLEKKDGVITHVKKKIKDLLGEIQGKIQSKLKAKALPKEDGDDGYDENNLPEYIQAIDGGENPM